MTKLTAEQRVQRAHVALMKHPDYCLYSGVFMIGKVEIKDDVPTACTNGRDVAYGRAFIDKLSEGGVKGVILHENLHKAFRHTTMWKHLYEDHAQMANMACDFVINLMIVDSDKGRGDVVLPKDGLYDPKYRGWDSQQVFNDLKEQAKKGSVHVKTVGDQQGKDIPVEKGGKQYVLGEGGEPLDEHDWEGAKEMGKEEKEALSKDIDQALRQGAILAGKMKGNVPREVCEALEAKVDWREALREFVNSFCMDKDESTWRRPSRRWIDQDVYMPSLIGESVGRIVVAIDTSGSIGGEEIGQFLGEVKKICETVRPDGIDLIYWDMDVCQHEKYEQDELENLLSSTKPKGGGGTDPQCVVDYIKAHKLKPECAVVLTDGYVGSWGKGWECPTLWGITTKGIESEVGKSVTIH
jgi:predicted metal-dependent peptidase